MNTPNHRHHRNQQQGAVLVVSLLILLVMTIIGVAGMQTTTLEEKMAGNMRDQNIAFQLAEAAIRAGETQATGLFSTGGFVSDGSTYLHTRGSAPDPFDASEWAGNAWTNPESTTYDANSDGLTGVNPRYFIEIVGEVDSGGVKSLELDTSYGKNVGSGTVCAFRVVSQGTGLSGTANIVLESNFGVLIDC